MVGEDDWSDLMRSEELDPWMMAKLWESYCQARQENDPRKSTAQKVMKKSTDFVEADHRAVEGQGVPSLPPMSA